ncbi:ATP-binding protein [Paenibacillus sp. GD4]|uniref:sensor histidine kinase n=1 Tax=Paenibacillus sp. GD4 TaxID=3068890 RepID=UPI0027964D3F|nr:ATP-binding protein [Paenibacillus sp. GD4]MDQ1912171.1 ATP-binding protein [Paenibacillus sp. GD4]
MNKPAKVKKPWGERFPFNRFPFTLVKGMLSFIKDMYVLGKTHVERSLRLQLMITFGICLLGSMLFYGISKEIFGMMKKEPVIDYSMSISRIENEARSLVRQLDPVSWEDIEHEEMEDEAGSNGSVPAQPVQPGVPVPGAETAPAQGAVPPPAQDTAAPSAQSATAPQAQSAAAAPQSAASPTAQGVTTPQAQSTATTSRSRAAQPAAAGTNPQRTLTPAEEQRRKEIQESRLRDFYSRVKRLAANEKYKVVITDLEGRTVYRSENATETTVDLHGVIRNAMESRTDRDQWRQEFSSFYPVNYNGQKSYLIVSGIPEPHISYERGQSPLAFLSALAVFIFMFYYLTQRKMRYVEELAAGLRMIATGNLEYRVEERTKDELGSLARGMNMMVEDLQNKIEEERRAERIKNELITNVSHDLRTPLTLIMGYLRLLHDKNYETPEQAAGYVGIAYSKSEKLKSLIDDLFEYSKLAHEDVPLYKKGVVINELLEQLLEEYVSLSEEQQFTIVRSVPSEKLTVLIDTDKMIRVFENLISNAIKYSPKPGTISIGMARERSHVIVRISNKADELSAEELERLFDRFYRVDAARTSETGGSGLGLAIAKSIVESHEGSIWAETSNGEIHFYVKLKLVS